MDGRILALARKEKEDIRLRSVAEDRRRHAAAYARVPALRDIDARLAELVGEMASAMFHEGRPVEEIRKESLLLQAERGELLVENGWPLDWLDGAWDCAKCRDTGYSEGAMCSCLRKLYDKHQTESLSELLRLGDETFGTFDLSLYDDAPDPESRVSPRTQMTKVLGVCRRYAESFGPDSPNLLFWGNTGLGKTFLSGCIARVAADRGASVVYVTAASAVEAFEEHKFRPDDESEEKVRRLLSCELLILDDLGTEHVTEFSKSAVYRLVNTRLLDRKKTIISTNLSPDDLESRYTSQIASRLRGEYQILPFVGRDIRLVKKERRLS